MSGRCMTAPASWASHSRGCGLARPSKLSKRERTRKRIANLRWGRCRPELTTDRHECVSCAWRVPAAPPVIGIMMGYAVPRLVLAAGASLRCRNGAEDRGVGGESLQEE
eukprot:3486130-Rhodomonas_salina.1